jgi:hypothetical protein
MTDLPMIPEYLVRYLFNINQGSDVMAPCKKCGEATKQVIISYENLPALKELGLAGRALDIFPLGPVILGRPTLCHCGTVNRLARTATQTSKDKQWRRMMHFRPATMGSRSRPTISATN